MTMTMTELKPLAVSEFNSHVSDAYAQQYFDSCFDLWLDNNSRFKPGNNGYKAVIMRHAQNVNAAAVAAKSLLESEHTKRTSALSTSLSEDRESADSKDITINNDGEFTRTQRNYPDGYTAAPDEAYIAAQTHDGEFERSEITDRENNAKKEAESAQTAESVESDIISRANALAAYRSTYDVIELLVFEFVDFGFLGSF